VGSSPLFDYPGSTEHSGLPVFLSRRSEADWALLLTYTRTLRFRAGDVLLRDGETTRALYMLSSGSVEVLLHRADRGEVPVATIGAGSVFGEIAFLDGRPRSGTVRAREDGEAILLDFESFEALSARTPSLATAILLDLGRIVAARLRETDAMLAAST
jgi:CRP-like cAMP-binding protein